MNGSVQSPTSPMRYAHLKASGLPRRAAFAILVLCIGILAFGSALWAEDPKLQVSVDRTRVGVGERVTLTVSVSLEGQEAVSEPELAVPDGFDVLGRSSSTNWSISIANGVVTHIQTISFIYTLRAQREGSYLVGPVKVTHQGKTHTASPVRVEVVKGRKRRQVRPAPGPGQSLGAQDLGEIGESLFIQAKPDRRTVYVGEQVTLSYTLYNRIPRLRIHNYDHLPTYTGFWAKKLFDAFDVQRVSWNTEVVDGRKFEAGLLKVVALFPTTAGKQALEELELLCSFPVRSKRRGLLGFDSFFDMDAFGETKQITVRSNGLELEAMPLPAGAPAGFAGAVGRLQISAEATPTTVAEGDPIVLKVKVSGTGNLNAVPEPTRPAGETFRFYDPKASVEIEKRENRLGGRKTFEYVVIPQKAGERQIPPFRLAYFDPDQKRYATVRTAPIALVINPGAEPFRPAPAPMLSRDEIKVLGEDIRYIKPDMPVLEVQGRALYRNWGFLALQAVPVLGFLGVFAYRRHRERLMGDVAYARRRRSRSDARRRLAYARRLMASGENRAFHSEIYRALAQFLADRLNCPVAGMAADSAVEALAGRGVSEEVIAQVRKVFQRCDFARFAPSEVSNGEMEKLYKAAEGLVDELGRKV